MRINSAGCIIGHKGRCFDTRLLTGNRLLTASEDGTAKIFSTQTKQQIASFNHGSETEVLRAACVKGIDSESGVGELICTCGANGLAVVWSCKSPEKSVGLKSLPRKELALRHSSGSTTNPAQIYTCEVVSEASGLFVTAADDILRVWDMDGRTLCSTDTSAGNVEELLPQQSLQFTSYTGGSDTSVSGVGSATFGGVRNPDDLCYIFDAKVAPGCTNLLGVACSDGTTRMVDLRSSQMGGSAMTAPVCTQMLPINQFLGIDTNQENVRGLYPTSLTFDGDHLVWISLSNGYILACDNRQNVGNWKPLLPVSVIPAHQSTCYGCARVPVAGKDVLMSWGGDGHVRAWDMAVDYTLPVPPSGAATRHYSNALGEHSLNPTKGSQRTSVYSCCIEPLAAPSAERSDSISSVEAVAAPSAERSDSISSVEAVATQRCRTFCGVSDATATFMGTPVPVLNVEID